MARWADHGVEAEVWLWADWPIEGEHPVGAPDVEVSAQVRLRTPPTDAEATALRFTLARAAQRANCAAAWGDDASPSFHYVRGPDGAIAALGGDADGAPLAVALGLDPTLQVRLQIVADLAELVEAAEADGALHLAMSAAAVRIDEDGAISLSGFGAAPDEVAEAEDPALPEPDRWYATQRRGLGELASSVLADELGAPLPEVPGPVRDALSALRAADAAERPAPRALAEAARAVAPSPALPAWLDGAIPWGARLLPALPRPKRPRASGPDPLAARRAAGARGVLAPCPACNRRVLPDPDRPERPCEACVRAQTAARRRAWRLGLGLGVALCLALAWALTR